MVDSKLLRCETSEDLTICPTTTVKGTVSFKGIGLACRTYVEGSTHVHISPVFGGKWKIYMRVGQDNTKHVGLFLERHFPESDDWPNDNPYAWDVTMRVAKHVIKYHMFDVFRFDDSPDWGLKQFCTIDELAKDPQLIKMDVMDLDFDIRGYPDDFGSRQALVLKPSIQTQLLQAYRLLFDDYNTADVQFVCSGPPGKPPKYVYAHSAILGHLSEYFKTMFASGFAEAVSTASVAPGGNAVKLDDPESDFEDLDEDEEKGSADQDPTATVDPAEPSSSTREGGEEDSSATLPALPSRDRNYKVVRINDTPHRTFRALIYYLYTGTVAFAPLKSTYLAERTTAIAEGREAEFPSKAAYYESKTTVTPLTEKVSAAWASAKSMYTLCDKFDVPELKKAAKLHIKDSLTPENIMPELFSAYAAKHDEIYEAELEYVKTNWAEINSCSGFKAFVKDMFLTRSQDPRTSKTWLDILEASSY